MSEEVTISVHVCVILHMSVIAQYGNSPLMLAADWGRTGAIKKLVNAGANLDLQDEVCQ